MKLKTKLTEIFKTFFLLSLLFDEELKLSAKFRGILIKEVEERYISIIGLEMGQTIEEAIQKLNLILERTTKEEKLILLMQEAHHIIFQGPYDDDFDKPVDYEPGQIIEPLISSIDKGKSLKEVDLLWTLVPGMKLIGILKKIGRHTDITAFKEEVKKKWAILL